MKKLIFLAVSVISINIGTISMAQSLKIPAKSPLASVKQAVGLSDVSVEYSRPSKNGRVIFGDLVPFGEIWRTGANACTKITFGEDVKVNGQAIKAGTYSVFTIPNKTEWTIIFNKNLGLWGTNGYSETDDIARILVKAQKLSQVVETFTFQFSTVKATQLTLDMIWENTKISLDIVVDVEEKVMKDIESIMFQDKKPYHQAAQYYYDNKKDMKQALEWATKAFELNPKAYWSAMLKAKIQLELNDSKAAILTAEQVKKLAEEDKDTAYIKQADELIKQAKSKK